MGPLPQSTPLRHRMSPEAQELARQGSCLGRPISLARISSRFPTGGDLRQNDGSRVLLPGIAEREQYRFGEGRGVSYFSRRICDRIEMGD